MDFCKIFGTSAAILLNPTVICFFFRFQTVCHCQWQVQCNYTASCSIRFEHMRRLQVWITCD
jgi:hypothetical protein